MHHQIHQFHDFRMSFIVSPDVWSLPTSWRAVWLVLRWQVEHKVHHHHEASSTAQKPCAWSLTLQYFCGLIYTNQLNKFKDRKHDTSEYSLDCFDCMRALHALTGFLYLLNHIHSYLKSFVKFLI